MKKSIFKVFQISITILFIFIIGNSEVFAEIGPTSKSNATSGPTRYNNNFNTFTPAQQKVLTEKYGGDASKVTSDRMCGDKCAAILDSQSKGETKDAAEKAAELVPLTKVEVNGNGTVTSVTAGDTDKNKANSSTATDNILGLEEGKLKAGDVDMNTIPIVIVNLISTLLAIAGTVAIFSLIYHAVKMQINSGITGDSSGVDSAKKGMIGALIGFVIAISAWFLVTQAVSLLGSVTN